MQDLIESVVRDHGLKVIASWISARPGERTHGVLMVDGPFRRADIDRLRQYLDQESVNALSLITLREAKDQAYRMQNKNYTRFLGVFANAIARKGYIGPGVGDVVARHLYNETLGARYSNFKVIRAALYNDLSSTHVVDVGDPIPLALRFLKKDPHIFASAARPLTHELRRDQAQRLLAALRPLAPDASANFHAPVGIFDDLEKLKLELGQELSEVVHALEPGVMPAQLAYRDRPEHWLVDQVAKQNVVVAQHQPEFRL